jgi:uncharacterized membrane protein
VDAWLCDKVASVVAGDHSPDSMIGKKTIKGLREGSRRQKEIDTVPEPASIRSRESAYLRRVETLVDCTYAVVLVIAVAGLPTPRDVGWSGDSPWDFLSLYSNDFLVGAVGLVLVVSYWLQNLAVLGSLCRSDARHAMLVVLQLVFLLIYLFGMTLGVDLEMHLATLLIQSTALMLMGIMALISWRYATIDRRLLPEGISDEEIEDVWVRMIPEPLTAALTLIAVPFGADAWEATWLLFPVFAWFLNRRKKRRRTQTQS